MLDLFEIDAGVVKRWDEVIWDSTPSSRIFADEDTSACGFLESINSLYYGSHRSSADAEVLGFRAR